MTKTEYKDINEAPEENNFNFSVLIHTPNIQQNAFRAKKVNFAYVPFKKSPFSKLNTGITLPRTKI